MKNFVTLCAIVSLLFLSACGGRKAAPVQTVKTNDVNLSCQQIELELISNNDQIKRLLQEHGKTVGNNVGIGALSLLLFPPMLLAMDLKGAAKQEANAYIGRNRNLVNVANQKACRFNTIDLEEATREFSLKTGNFKKAKPHRGPPA